MEDYKQKIILTLTKNKNIHKSSNSSKKRNIKRYNPIKTKLLFSKKISINKFLYNNKSNNLSNIKNSNSSGKTKKRHINIKYNLSDHLNNSYKKTISLSNSSKKYIIKLKNKLFFNISKDSMIKRAQKAKKINFSFINANINKTKLYKKNIKKNINNFLIDKNNFFPKSNYNNYINNTNTNYSNSPFLDMKKDQPNKIKLNHITTEPYFLIYQRNKPLFKSNTYDNLEIICEGINNNINNINNINNNINNININCINNKQRRNNMSPKVKNNFLKIFENKKSKKNKNNSFIYLTSINNNNYTNILNYNFSKKKIYNKKKIKLKSKNQNKSLNNNNNSKIKSKLNDLKEKIEKLFEENIKNSKRNKYNIIKDKFDESINIMGLNEDEKNFLKLIMNKYNDVISSYSKENKILKNKSEKVQNLNIILDRKYSDLENKYNQNMKLLKEFQSNIDNFNNNLNNDIININKNSVTNKKKYNIYNNTNKNNNKVNDKKDKDTNLLNKLNINDLNFIYFNDKIKVLNCKNSNENYKKEKIFKLSKLK